MGKRRLWWTVSTAAVIGLFQAITAGTAAAGGFSLFVESGAAAVGNAQAGSAALAEDATTVFYNPAGLTRLKDRQLSMAASALGPSANFSNSGSTSAIPSIPLTGGNGGDAGSWAFVPAGYYAMDVTSRLKFGMGFNSPFGLKTEYDNDWVGRYHAIKSELITISMTPALAFKVNDRLSLGVGFIAEWAKAELTKAIDFGAACFGSAFGPAACTGAGILPQTKDGRAKVEGEDWGFGYSLGVLYQVVPSTRVGVAYRSKITHVISGTATYRKPSLPAPFTALTSTAVTSNNAAKASVTLPETLSISSVTQITPKWSVLGDVTWTNWSRFDELRIRFSNGAPDSVTKENWRDTVRLAMAVNYQATDAWKLRAGWAYDPTPVKDKYRTPRVPDEDRVWLSLGTNVKISAASSLDFAYAHLFVRDASIKDTASGAGTLQGNYDSDVNVITAQLNYRF
ncbi:MAG: outer membrane protein transport protein [Kofleriaceae bacterium]|nr:outer membrane protein transport protein [Candidatus Methylomirabilis lanthanidiphila]